MEEVYLSSDVLIAYFRQPGVGKTDRREQAAAVMQRVYAEELTVHLTDITLFQVLKFLLEVDDSERVWQRSGLTLFGVLGYAEDLSDSSLW